MRIPLTICGFRLQFVESSYNFRILLTICGFQDSLILLNTYIIICLWISQTVPDSANFVADSTKFVADSANLPVFGAIFSIKVF